jgi:NADH-ubiquinone oxidoreductase chain 2
MSSNDLVSIFLSIELQSYALYLICSIYRNSELATNAGLNLQLYESSKCKFRLILYSTVFSDIIYRVPF